MKFFSKIVYVILKIAVFRFIYIIKNNFKSTQKPLKMSNVIIDIKLSQIHKTPINLASLKTEMLIIGSNKPSKALSVFYHIKALTSNVNESFKTSFSLSRIILITSLASQGISFAYTVLVWHNRYSRKGSGGRISKFSVYKYNVINIKHPNCWGKISHFVHLIIKFWFNYMVKIRHYLFQFFF